MRASGNSLDALPAARANSNRKGRKLSTLFFLLFPFPFDSLAFFFLGSNIYGYGPSCTILKQCVVYFGLKDEREEEEEEKERKGTVVKPRLHGAWHSGTPSLTHKLDPKKKNERPKEEADE